MSKRRSHRTKKRVNYNENEDSDVSGEEDDDYEQPGTSPEYTHDQTAPKCKVWPVTCGNKKGILHVGKLKRGERCISSEGHWFTPGAFEKFGGKASNKKWKASIFFQDKPLQFWIEEGFLPIMRFKRTGTKKRKLTHNPVSSDSSEEAEILFAKATEEDDVEDEIWVSGSERSGQETEEEKEEIEDEDIPAVADSDKDNNVFEENEEDREHNDSTIDDPTDPSLMSDPPVDGGAEEEKGEFMQSNEQSKGGQGEIKVEKCQHSPTSSIPDVRPDLSKEDSGSSSSNCQVGFLLRPLLNRPATFRDVATNRSPTVLPLRVHRASALGTPSKGPISTHLNLDTMDQDQLKREKIKIQLKVLKLQNEYYTLKIKNLRK